MTDQLLSEKALGVMTEWDLGPRTFKFNATETGLPALMSAYMHRPRSGFIAEQIDCHFKVMPAPYL